MKQENWKKEFDKIKNNYPDWEWNKLEGRGFYELMQNYRHLPLTDYKEVIKSFEIVKQFIKNYEPNRKTI